MLKKIALLSCIALTSLAMDDKEKSEIVQPLTTKTVQIRTTTKNGYAIIDYDIDGVSTLWDLKQRISLSQEIPADQQKLVAVFKKWWFFEKQSIELWDNEYLRTAIAFFNTNLFHMSLKESPAGK